MCVCVCVCVMKQTNVERLNMDVGDFKRFWKLNIKFLGHYFTYFQLSADFKRFWKLNIKFLGHYFTYFQLSASFFVIFFCRYFNAVIGLLVIVHCAVLATYRSYTARDFKPYNHNIVSSTP